MNTKLESRFEASLTATLMIDDSPADLTVRAVLCQQIDDACLTKLRNFALEQDSYVLVLYSDGQVADETRAIEAGADECLRLGFNVQKLTAQIKRLSNRTSSNIINRGSPDLRVDSHTYKVFVDGRSTYLGPQTFKLLAELWLHRGRVVLYEQLERVLYNETGRGCRHAIRQLIYRLRSELGTAGECVEAVPGIGYILRPEISSATSETDNEHPLSTTGRRQTGRPRLPSQGHEAPLRS